MLQSAFGSAGQRCSALRVLYLQEEIAAVGKIMTFDAGEIVMDYGSYVRMVPLIIEGSIKVTREDDTLAKELLLYFINVN